MNLLNTNKQYRNIFIIESRVWWASCSVQFDSAKDLVLTYDFGLKQDVENLGGQAYYLDYLVSQQVMQENNFLVYQFFRDWHLDANRKDIFEYQNVPFGFSFRLEIWNDLISYSRTRICLEQLRDLKFDSILIGTELTDIASILDEMSFSYTSVAPVDSNQSTYYFPIHRWLDEKVRYHGLGGLKYKLRDFVTSMQGSLMSCWDSWFTFNRNKPVVFIQEYYPTKKLVQRLYQESKVKLVLASFSRNYGWFRYVPIWGREAQFQADGKALMQRFRQEHSAKLILLNKIDVSEHLYKVIDKRVSVRIAETLRTLDSVINHLDKNPVNLEVLIANIGKVATLVDCVCKSRGIPSYMIINGMLCNEFMDEAKYATVINAYSTSIKEHYFRGMDNIVCLGDPRMDVYVNGMFTKREVNRKIPTVTIGASGHNNTDLNSYLAVEFEFLYDVLKALQTVKEQGESLRVVIKVRANGYRGQYESFVAEYFPGMVSEIIDSQPMATVLEKTDFYISIYSQTLFEASCLRIPCLYYKKDTEILDPPFNGDCELVTVNNVKDLVHAITDFQNGHSRYDAFLQKQVMEKYIGPLDGLNLERNLNFIYELFAKGEKVDIK